MKVLGQCVSPVPRRGSCLLVVETLKTLGIVLCEKYVKTFTRHLEVLCRSVRELTELLSTLVLKVFQQTSVVNFKVLSKVWCLSHCFPLSRKVTFEVENIFFWYMWIGQYSTIRRSSLCASKAVMTIRRWRNDHVLVHLGSLSSCVMENKWERVRIIIWQNEIKDRRVR